MHQAEQVLNKSKQMYKEWWKSLSETAKLELLLRKMQEIGKEQAEILQRTDNHSLQQPSVHDIINNAYTPLSDKFKQQITDNETVRILFVEAEKQIRREYETDQIAEEIWLISGDEGKRTAIVNKMREIQQEIKKRREAQAIDINQQSAIINQPILTSHQSQPIVDS